MFFYKRGIEARNMFAAVFEHPGTGGIEKYLPIRRKLYRGIQRGKGQIKQEDPVFIVFFNSKFFAVL